LIFEPPEVIEQALVAVDLFCFSIDLTS